MRRFLLGLSLILTGFPLLAKPSTSPLSWNTPAREQYLTGHAILSAGQVFLGASFEWEKLHFQGVFGLPKNDYSLFYLNVGLPVVQLRQDNWFMRHILSGGLANIQVVKKSVLTIGPHWRLQLGYQMKSLDLVLEYDLISNLLSDESFPLHHQLIGGVRFPL